MAKRIERTCIVCGSIFQALEAQIKRGLGKTCSYSCASKSRIPYLTVEERFWSKVDKSGGLDACWPWLGKTSRGYAYFYPDHDRFVPTARMAYELTYGPMPKGTQACRHCDNRLCCNPKHISPGTHKSRALEREAKGRGSKGMPGLSRNLGEKNPNVKYTPKIVRRIRNLHRTGHSYGLIGTLMGINPDYIKLIVKRRRWKHVE